MDLVRQLQITYKMEPAGSQGVWSLDDYQFVPFIWGSSQLMMNPKISPEMFTATRVVEENAEEYLFLACIKFIMKVAMCRISYLSMIVLSLLCLIFFKDKEEKIL